MAQASEASDHNVARLQHELALPPTGSKTPKPGG
jgi:hypothetical protein